MSPTNLFANDEIGDIPSVGGGGSPWSPPIGMSVYNAGSGSATNAGTTSNALARLIPFPIYGDMTVDQMAGRFDVAGGVSEISYWALYRAEPDKLTLAGEIGSYTPATVATFGLTIASPINVTAGMYYVVWQNEGPTNTAAMRAHGAPLHTYMWTHDPLNLAINQSPAVDVANARSGSVWANELTTGFTQVQSRSMPLVLLRRSA